MQERGFGGELLLAQLRAALFLGLLLLSLIGLAIGSGNVSAGIAHTMSLLAAFALALLWLALARQSRPPAWLPWASTGGDVTLVSLALLVLAPSAPTAMPNHIVVWGGYLIAIVMTALRSDGRLVLFVGLLASVEFGVIALGAPLATAPTAHGLPQLAMIAIATLITAVITCRMQQLAELSGIDGMTGLPNRTLLAYRFPALIERVQTEGGTVTLCVINLDYFKQVNDDIGHPAGDDALRHVAHVLQSQLGEGDWLARLGGGEFALLLATPVGPAWERVETMRRALAGAPFQPEPEASPVVITLSAGIAGWPQDGIELSQLLRCADLRLRQAKMEGRNRVVAREH